MEEYKTNIIHTFCLAAHVELQFWVQEMFIFCMYFLIKYIVNFKKKYFLLADCIWFQAVVLI